MADAGSHRRAGVAGAPLQPFPRPLRGFVGRERALRRVLERAGDHTLHVVRGAAGVGKSELVTAAIDELRAGGAWRDAVLVRARPDFKTEHVLAHLRLRAGVTRTLPLASGAASSLAAELEETARALEARPLLVVVDDVHHLETAPAARMLATLSRSVRRSRVFVTSRAEVPLPPGTPPPAVHDLGPLDASGTASLVAGMSERLGVAPPEARAVARRTGGNPFLIQREIAALAAAASPGDSSVDDAVSALTGDARQVLLVGSVVRGGVSVQEVVRALPGVAAQAAVLDLARHVLLDTGRDVIAVHELVRDVLARHVSDAEIRAAHRAAASLHAARCAADDRSVADAVEQIHHLARAGETGRAWDEAEAWQGALMAAGLDHLLLGDLAVLCHEVPDRRTDIELTTARVLVRRSRAAEAQGVLRRIGRRGGGVQPARYLALAATVAERQGKLRRAQELHQRALSQSRSPAERFEPALRLADVLSLRGLGAEARRLAGEASEEHERASARERGRWGASVALAYLVDERFEEAADAAARAAGELAAPAPEVLPVALAMIEVLARAESDDVAGALDRHERTLAPAAAAGAVRDQVASVYRAVIAFAAGQLRDARVALEWCFGRLWRAGDRAQACVAGHYLGMTCRAQGEFDAATEIADRVVSLATEAELATLVPHGTAAHASAVLAAGDVRDARRLAGRVLGSEASRVDARWTARTVVARAHALEGHLEAARRELETARAEAAREADRHYRAAADLEVAEIEVMGGEPARVIEAAERAARHYAAAGRRWHEARAAVALAAGHAARGERADRAAAGEALARARTLAAREGYPGVASRCALVSAALEQRAGRPERARGLVVGALRQLSLGDDRPEVAALRAALAPRDDRELPGVRAKVSFLGLSGSARFRVIDRSGSRLATEEDVVRERSLRDVVVEPARGVITASRGERAERGRPVACAVMARLVAARGAAVSARTLFVEVWGGGEYRPLEHRNTVYLGVGKLRRTLRKLVPDREVVETAPGGWRIADGIDAAAALPEELAVSFSRRPG